MLLNLRTSCKFVFFGGKGGVGKTTCSSAFALGAARRGRRTLLVSTDPAHNLTDIFSVALGSDPVEVSPRLHAVEVNPEKEAERYLAAVADGMRSLVSHEMRPEVDRYMQMAKAAPGASEAAVFDRLVSVILDEAAKYDVVVFDTAPSGHTLRLLNLPESLSAWIAALVARREKVTADYHAWLGDAEPVSDRLLDILRERKRRFEAVRAIMLDADRCAVVFVLIPEKLPIAETSRAVDALSGNGIGVDTLVVNKILPEGGSHEFYLSRWKQQLHYLERIEAVFAGRALVRVPMLRTDVSGPEDLAVIAANFDHAVR